MAACSGSSPGRKVRMFTARLLDRVIPTSIGHGPQGGYGPAGPRRTMNGVGHSLTEARMTTRRRVAAWGTLLGLALAAGPAAADRPTPAARGEKALLSRSFNPVIW